MAISYLGRRTTSPEIDIGQVGAGGQRASVYDSSSQTLIVYQLGAWVGTDSGSPVARIFLGTATGSGPDPAALLAYTAEFSPAATYVDITGGASYVYNVTPVIALPGRYSLGVTARNGVVGHSMRAAVGISALNRNFYDKYGLGSTVPTNPIGGAPSYNGHMSVWAVGMVNERPAVPTALSPSGTTAGSLTPAMTSHFSDPNETLPNGVAFDYLNQVQVQVRDMAGTSKWDRTYTASSGERSADTASVTYAGSALVYGTSYQWRTRHSDRAGAWSDWTTWTTFTVPSAGTVAQPTAPTGKITTLTPTVFVAKWTHQTSLSTNAVEARLRVNGAIVKASPTIAKTVAHNANISISWAETTFSDLQWGTPYDLEIRGRDAGGIWSSWSPIRTFTTNSAPSVPGQLTPVNNAVVTTYPLLKAKATDADGDALTVKFRIKNSSGTVLFTRTGTLVSGQYQYQVTTTDFTTFATYKWDAYAYDGSLYSGTQTVEANAVASTEQTIVYAQGPVVTITAPANLSTQVTGAIQVAWTVTGQVKREVLVYRADGSLLGTSGEATTGVTNYLLSMPFLNNQTYTIVVKVTDANPLVGYASATFTLVYTPASIVSGFTAYPVSIGTDATPSAVMMEWEPTEYAASRFLGYDVYRVALNGIGGTATGPREHLRHISSPLQTAWLDAQGASRQAYEYQVIQTIQQSLDVLTSDPATGQVQLMFDGVVLGNVYQPETFHTDFRYPAANGNEGEWELRQEIGYVLPLGGRKSRAIRGTRQEWNPSGSYSLITDEAATAQQRYAAFQELAEHGGTLCYRDGRGYVGFVSLSSAKVAYRRIMRYDVAVTFQEVDFVPGEDVA